MPLAYSLFPIPCNATRFDLPPSQDVAIPLVTNKYTFYLTYVACFTPTASLLLLLLSSPETTCISPNKINVGPHARPVVELPKTEERI